LISQDHWHCSEYLICGICAQHIQWWSDKLRFDRDGVVALFLSSLESLFDGVNAGRCVACKLDIGAEFYGLGCQTTSDRGGKNGEGRGGDWLREGSKDSFGFAVCSISVGYRGGPLGSDTYASASLKAS